MLYKHWKKVLLSLTAFFWASCDNSTSAEDDNASSSSSAIETPKSSSATEGTVSSSEEATPGSSSSTEKPATSSESATPKSSSSAEGAASSASEDNPNITSSASVDKSSSSEMIAPKYGVPMSSSMVAAKYGVIMPSSSSEGLIAAKYGVVMPSPTCERTGKSKLSCDDGVTCEETVSETMQYPECTGDVCAKYGVVIVKESTYKCDDGNVYNEAEFRSKYQILDGAVDLYGCPSDICGDFPIEENLPLYGVSSTVTRPNN